MSVGRICSRMVATAWPNERVRVAAHRMAEQVKRTRRPVTLEPMPPNERRIIHLALAEDRQVETASTGEGDARKVAINPRR